MNALGVSLIGGHMKLKAKAGKTLKSSGGKEPVVQLHLLVTRSSGDTERYKLGELPNMMAAIEYKRKLIAVKVPKRWLRKWVA